MSEIVTLLGSVVSFRERPINSTHVCASKTHSCKKMVLVSL
jgi:hypothetical protein